MELYLGLNNLRAALNNDQPLPSAQLSKPFCAALIPPLECVCSGLYVCETYLHLSLDIVNNVDIVYSAAQSFRSAKDR